MPPRKSETVSLGELAGGLPNEDFLKVGLVDENY